MLDKFHVAADQGMALQSQLGVIDDCFSGYSLADVFKRLKSKNTDWTTQTIQTMKKMVRFAFLDACSYSLRGSHPYLCT